MQDCNELCGLLETLFSQESDLINIATLWKMNDYGCGEERQKNS